MSIPKVSQSLAYYIILWMVAFGMIVGLLTRKLHDLSTPIAFDGDGLFFHALANTVFHEGWWFRSHQLGFPFEAPFITFPANCNVDYALVRLVGLFTHDAPTALNLAWIALLAAGGTGCAACMRFLGISSITAFILGLLYSIMPFAIYRNIAHFSLTPYLIIYPSTVALLSFDGKWNSLNRTQKWLLWVGCALLGLNYVYYAFFGCLILAIALIAKFFRRDREKWFSPAGVAFIIILLATFANLSPSLHEWASNGCSPNVRAKMPQEFDYYGLKLRHLLTPLWEHSFPLFRSWLARDFEANFPLETENTTARLGIIGCIGFITLLLAPVIGRRAWPESQRRLGVAITILSVGLMLYAVTGGLGSLFNLLVSPEIRSPNRVTPYLYFFCLLTMAIQLDRLRITPSSVWRRSTYFVTTLGLLTLGVWDQAHAFIGLNRSRRDIRESTNEIRDFVQDIENTTHGSAKIFQLPITEFLNDPGKERMVPYDHFRPTIFSSKIYWSYPSMSHRSQVWTAYARSLPPKELIIFLSTSGFNHLWFDRFGYADKEVETIYSSFLGAPRFESHSRRYVVYNLPPASNQVLNSPSGIAARQFLEADVRLQFSPGFYNAEVYNNSILRWSKRDSVISISNHGSKQIRAKFHAQFSSLAPGPVQLQIVVQERIIHLVLSNKPEGHEFLLSVSGGATTKITFHQIDESIALPNDHRQLYFSIVNPYLEFQNN